MKRIAVVGDAVEYVRLKRELDRALFREDKELLKLVVARGDGACKNVERWCGDNLVCYEIHHPEERRGRPDLEGQFEDVMLAVGDGGMVLFVQGGRKADFRTRVARDWGLKVEVLRCSDDGDE